MKTHALLKRVSAVLFLWSTLIALTTTALAQASNAATEDEEEAPTETPKPKRTRKPRADGEKGTPRTKGTAHVRVLHAIPGAPAVDVYVDGQKVASDLDFKELSNYIPLTSGRRTFRIATTGKTETLLEEKLGTTKDKYYTVFLHGTADKPLLRGQNELASQISEGKGRVRVFHLALEAPENMSITSPSTRAKKGYTNFMSTLVFGKVRTKLVAPGTLTLQVRDGDKIIKEVSGVTIEEGKRYSIFLVGKIGASGAQAFDVLVKPAAAQ